ncbi:hypothetical protein KZZ07_02200 [Mameliella sp. CS4]|uniref:hypothetical protein n=1 Tax=Mameliella sp. CS4 TaxID=2862329 RepID=UPI001C5DA6E1|nr:hypothetical protein [Mameliella sp. CS4]MBW4981340.1 hypothetical protein [Mameliella sp. CS4]
MWIRHKGDVTRFELRELFERLHGENAPEAPSKNFTDLARIKDVEFGFKELHWHSLRLQERLRSRNQRLIDSVHAPDGVSFGLARIYQQVVDPDGPLQVHVHDERKQALAALALPHIPEELL